MGVSGIGTTDYAGAYAAQTNDKVSENTFVNTLSEKADVNNSAYDKTDYNQRALEAVGANAPESVKQAWMEAAEEVGANGLGMLPNGMLSHISQLQVQRGIAWMNGETDCGDVLGTSVESAIAAVKKAIYDLDNPLEPYTTKSIEVQRQLVKEREFYAAFLEKLEKLRTTVHTSGNGFSRRIENTYATYQISSGNGNNRKTSNSNTAMEAYLVSAANHVNGLKTAYDTYESENYKLVPDNETGCFDIYNKQGEHLGVFSYSDIKIRQDAATGKQFLISEHGTMSYDALVLDEELKEDLENAMGIDSLETEALQGYTLKTHSGTGIQFLVRAGEEGRGGKVLLQSEVDKKQYEALAETYFNKYPNLITDKNAAYIWADLEIKGLAQHTDTGIISMGFHGMSYDDNSDYKNNWSVLFSGNTYQTIYDWFQNNRADMEEIQKFAMWQDIFDNIGSQYERIWSDKEEKQGYLNN